MPTITKIQLSLALLALSTACLVAACDDGGPSPHDDLDVSDLGDLEPDSPDTHDDTDVVQGFDDHTVPAIADRDGYRALAITGVGGQSVVKFLISDFLTASPRLRFYDSTFFELHDEWYWFRLLNGEPAPGSPTPPVSGMTFDTIEDVYTWARPLYDADPESLPLDLTFVSGERLYSPEFYRLALSSPRVYGVGSLIHVPARTEPEPRDELFVIELEYQDPVDHPQLVTYFESLTGGLPAEIADNLWWVVRSPAQETLARQMEQQLLPYHDRILRYDDLVVPGEVEVYSEGLTAGRVFKVAADEPEKLQQARATDLLMLELVPDFLPPAAGLVTAIPQTPLAHINVLARNRGIPNAYRGGLMDEAEIDQLARVRAPAVLQAIAPDQLDIRAITNDQFSTWRDLQTKDPISVPPVDTTGMAWTLDLDAVVSTITDDDDIEALRPVIGGKAAGFLGLLAPTTVVTPDLPMVITVRAYVEHMAGLRAQLDAVLAEASFRASARTRFLVLEGVDDYDDHYTSAADREFRDTYFTLHPATSPIGKVLRAGGIKRLIRDTPIAPATMSELRTALEARFGHYDASQGLRFRSSSSVEDIEGFNGAGLYDSNTGFFEPLGQIDPDDRDKTLEWAIKKTWASYWGFEAFEERELEKVVHTSGNMAVLVHARFDDPQELSNGVFTLRILPDGHPDRFVMELNVQDGAESVTNPTPGKGALPEVDILRQADDTATVRIERRAASNQVPDGTDILSDAELREIFAQARDVTELWRDRINATLPPEQQIQTLTLDFEFREMAEGWPALPSGQTPFPRRIVIKQARSLDPGLRGVPPTLLNLPIPRDLLARARRGERKHCTSSHFDLTTVEVYTDPLASPDMGHALDPFNAFASTTFAAGVPQLGVAPGTQLVLTWRDFESTHPTLASGEDAWDLHLQIAADSRPGTLHTLELASDGTYTLRGDTDQVTGSYTCETIVLLTTPEDYLRTLLATP